jgi:hypothetical protein
VNLIGTEARRRFPPLVLEEQDTYFVVRDRDGQQFAYVHFDNPRAIGTQPMYDWRELRRQASLRL